MLPVRSEKLGCSGHIPESMMPMMTFSPVARVAQNPPGPVRPRKAGVEAVSIGRQLGVRVQVSHLKAAGRSNHGRAGEALAVGLGNDAFPRRRRSRERRRGSERQDESEAFHHSAQ